MCVTLSQMIVKDNISKIIPPPKIYNIYNSILYVHVYTCMQLCALFLYNMYIYTRVVIYVGQKFMLIC